MNSPIRILHLEDSALDAELIKDCLESAGVACDVVIAPTRVSFERALEGEPFDLILCDFNIPGYDGVSALRAARAIYPLVPVIMISGGLSEYEAAECLHLGASDYVLKQSLVRLPIAIERVLRQADDRRQREELETKLSRAQRLESIGAFAGNIAHDLNNALAPVLMSLELIKLQYPEAPELLDTIESCTKHGAEMLRQLMVFSRGSHIEAEAVDTVGILEDLSRFIERTFPKGIQLRTRIPEELPEILGDRTQIHQALTNLCVNARDAMPTGGQLSLEAEAVDVDESYSSAIPGARTGQYLMLRVSDTGCGMPQEVLDRVFEPFFTTKAFGKGTGLGLSIVTGIAKGHQGFVNAYSHPGKGSTFAVYLPIEAIDSASERPTTDEAQTFAGHGELVLVVDDSDAIRIAASAVLSSLNFQVVTAEDGVNALKAAAEHQGELRAVITDFHMPNMDGLEFVMELVKLYPKLGIIVTSGNFMTESILDLKNIGINTFLDKPFTQEKLVGALMSVFEPQRQKETVSALK